MGNIGNPDEWTYWELEPLAEPAQQPAPAAPAPQEPVKVPA
jgi:hypothetical protein